MTNTNTNQFPILSIVNCQLLIVNWSWILDIGYWILFIFELIL